MVAVVNVVNAADDRIYGRLSIDVAARIAIEDAGQKFARAGLAVAVVVPVAVRGDEGRIVRPGVERLVVAECFGQGAWSSS